MDSSARTALSLMGGVAFALTFVPLPLRSKLDALLRHLWEKLFSSADPFAHIEVSRNTSAGIAAPSSSSPILAPQRFAHTTLNPFYSEVCLYLGSLNLEFATRRVSVSLLDPDDGQEKRLSHAPKFVFGLPLDETLVDTFQGAQVSWSHTVLSEGRSQHASPHRPDDGEPNNVFTLRMLKSHKQQLLHPYLNHISRVARRIKRQNTLRSLFTNGRSGSHWLPVILKHPSNFSTIALDGDLSERIQADLRAFSASESYYHRVGRAWKRGYLLYGPPGTGKSSLIAAIANYMHYDIYYLELTNVFSNSALQNLLMQTTRKSVIVIEDIDCSARSEISNRLTGTRNMPPGVDQWEEFDGDSRGHSKGFTLSGLLNFTDGLLSCYGEERIFIFTTNFKERLDSALLRCGRMDMHIHLSYCTFFMLKKLAVNYLGINNHPLYGELEEAMIEGVKITPATIAEILISERKSPDNAMRQILAAVQGSEPLDGGDEHGRVTKSHVSNPIDKIEDGMDGGKRKSPSLDHEGTHTEESSGKKQKAAVDENMIEISAMKETELCLSSAKHKGTVFCREREELRGPELRNLSAGGDDEVAGNCTPVNAKQVSIVKDSRTSERQCLSSAVRPFSVLSDANTMDSDAFISQGMIVDDSEDSSYEESDMMGCRWTINPEPFDTRQ